MKKELAWKADGKPPYMPQSIALEIQGRLERTFVQKEGEGNTTWAMVHSVCRELDATRKWKVIQPAKLRRFARDLGISGAACDRLEEKYREWLEE
jgi:hypothetical protein